MKTKFTKYIATFSTALFIYTLLFFSCEKEPESPEQTNKIVFTNIYVDSVSYYSAMISYVVENTNMNTITDFGICYDTVENPSIVESDTMKLNEEVQGVVNIDSLLPDKTYNFRFFAQKENEYFYIEKSDGKFNTIQTSVPSVSTGAISNISEYAAKCNGNVTTSGGFSVTEKGFCLGRFEKPDTSTNKIAVGDSLGEFACQLSELNAGVNYHICAYAINSVGVSYGEDKSFITSDCILPTVITNNITNITENSATCGGEVTEVGGCYENERGVCWSTSPNPTVQVFTVNYTNDGNGSGNFTSSITGLSPGTTYYVRAYARNSAGTRYGNQKSFTTINLNLISVSGATYQMGCTSEQTDCNSDETPEHTITLGDFQISKYETTNQQYADFMNEIDANSDGSYNGTEYLDIDAEDCQVNFTGGQFTPESGKENHPVIEVTWYGAKAFCEHYGGRLPTEAEWEFAARGGNSSNGYQYSGSDNIGDVAWYNVNSGGHTQVVGTKDPNELGIHDMSGNVWEWCIDWYDSDYYSNSPQNNPAGPSSGSSCVLRGGSWDFSAWYSRVANRSYFHPSDSDSDSGFRLVLPR